MVNNQLFAFAKLTSVGSNTQLFSSVKSSTWSTNQTKVLWIYWYFVQTRV